MKHFKDTKELPYSASQMYDLVADVARYNEFLPWTDQARIRSRKELDVGEEMIADLAVSFKVFRESYTSKVTLLPENEEGVCIVDVDAISGPFQVLRTKYVFTPLSETSCRMDLAIDFAFRNRLLQSVAGVAFEHAFAMVTNAFEKRAAEIYGVPEQPVSNNESA